MITNFFRIRLPFESFHIQQLPYSDDNFAALRKKHNKDASFFRHGEIIYVSPRKGAGLELGKLEKLNVRESTPVVMSLIRHLVFRSFREAFPDRIPESFSPLRFFSTKDEHDAIRHLLPADLQGHICYPRMVEIEARQIVENGNPTFGLLIRSRQRWQFNITLKELVDSGFDIVGKSVLEAHPIPGLEGVLAPDETLLGEIDSVSGEEAEITTNDGIIKRSLGNLHLQRNQQQIGAYLAFKIGEPKATRVFENLREGRTERERPGAFFTEARRFATWFVGSGSEPRVYENDHGFCFTVTMDSSFEGPSVPLHRTNLVFDYGPGASAATPLTGLSSFGPFNAARFEHNDLRVLALLHPQSRGAMTQFLKRLIDGIPESKYFQRGLKALFRLSSVVPVLKEVKSSFADAYEEAIDDAVRDSDNTEFDLALVECPDGSKLIPVKENPYYRARARLMSYGIPTQGVMSTDSKIESYGCRFLLG